MLKKRVFLFLYICVFIYTVFSSVSFAEENINDIISDASAFLVGSKQTIPEDPYCIIYSTPDTAIKYSVCFSDAPFYFNKSDRLTTDSSDIIRADFGTANNCFNSYSSSITSYLSSSKINVIYVNHDVMNYDGTKVMFPMSEPIQTPTPIPTKTPSPTNTPAPTKTPAPVQTSAPTNSPAADEEDNGGFWSSILSKITDLFDIVKQTFKDMRTKEFWSDFFDGIKLAFKYTEDSIISLKDSVIEFFKSFWNKLQDIFSWFDKTFKISELLNNIKSAFSSGIDKIWDWCKDFGENVKTFFLELPEKLKNWFVNLIDTLISFKDKVSSFFSSFWDNLKDAFFGIIDKIKGFFVGIKDVVVGGFNRVTGFFKNIWTSFSNLFVLPDNYFEDKFEEIVAIVFEKLGL